MMMCFRERLSVHPMALPKRCKYGDVLESYRRNKYNVDFLAFDKGLFLLRSISVEK